jgi:hypothetical protein
MGIARNTVRDPIRSEGPPKYQRPKRPSAVEPLEQQIRSLLSACPTIPATVIADRIGWTRGLTILKGARGRAPAAVPAAQALPADRLQPGELAQWDLWQPPVAIPVGFYVAQQLWVVTVLSAYSEPRWVT